jgi:photosystem II stability/assembly factor-like uncharacterized protein
MKALYISLFIFLLPINMFSQWEWQNPKPTGNGINAVQFTDSLSGFAVGKCGDIINTSDGGGTWELYNIGTCIDLNDLFFINSDVGFVVGVEGLILKTTDGAQSWSNVLSGTSESLNSVHFLDQDTGFIVGDNGLLLKSYDGGANWNSKIISNYNFNDFNDVYFLNHQIGFACHYGRVFKTTNGGITWNSQNIYENWYDITFISDSVGFIAGREGRLLRTTDQGNNWITIQLPTSKKLNSIKFIIDSIGYVVGENVIFKTINYGNDWDTITPPKPVTTLEDQFFFSEVNGILVGSGGRIFRTIDGGTNWNLYSPGTRANFRKLINLGDSSLYATAGSSILRSNDFGISWLQIFQAPNFIHSISFPTIEIGYAISYGDLYKTTDTGSNWEMITHIGDVNTMDFVNNNFGFTAGDQRRIFKTSDGGLTWYEVNTPNNFWLTSIDMADSLHGCAVGLVSMTYYTSNGGETWHLVDLYPPEIQFLRVKMYDRYRGIATALYGQIYKTTNGGLSWTERNSGVITALYDVFYLNQDVIYVTGEGGVILKSTNAGETWSMEQQVTRNDLYSIVLLNSNLGFATGVEGTILRYGDIPTSLVLDNQNTIPSTLSLSQNYPNPFNPTTIISWQSPVGSWQILKIYDVLGNEVVTLVDEYRQAGNYEVEFSAANLPSGVYFYRIQAGSYIETRKMVLLR